MRRPLQAELIEDARCHRKSLADSRSGHVDPKSGALSFSLLVGAVNRKSLVDSPSRPVAADRILTQVFNCFCSISEQENTG